MKIKFLAILLLSFITLGAIEIPLAPVAVPISVSLSGYVRHPGVYQLSPTNRLSDLLAMEMALDKQDIAVKAFQEPAKPNPQQLLAPVQPGNDEATDVDFYKLQALRSIKLIRGGLSTTYDLLRFYRLGELEQNPYLQDNDVVVISAIDKFVTLSGGINLPGDLEFVPGDKLEDIVQLSMGFSFDADPAKLTVYRYLANRIDYEVLKLDYRNNNHSFALQADDRILIPQDSEIRTRQRVKISGQVKNPGEYVIEHDTTLNDLIIQAGGITSRGDLKNLVFYNEKLNSEPDMYLEMLMQRSMSDMTPLEYSYLRSGLLQLKGKYSFDAGRFAATSGQEANPLLHEGDHLFIPEKMDMVWVSGQVRHPGLVPWVEGKDWDYYIQAAGGYANNRKVGKGRLIRGLSGNWVKPDKNLPIMPGDTVFVPGQTDRSLWVDIKDVATLASSLITIIIGLQALTSK